MASVIRSKSGSGIAHHPFIVALGETEANLRDLIAKFSRAGDQVMAGILALDDARDGRTDLAEALTVADRTALKDVHPELAAFFLERWAMLSIKTGRLAEGDALLRRARELISRDTHPVIESSVLRCEALLAEKRGNQLGARGLQRQALAVVSGERRPPFLLSYARLLATQWEEILVDAEFDALTVKASKTYLSGLAMCRFIQFFETGRTSEALAQLAIVEEDAPLSAVYRDELKRAKTILAVMCGNANQPDDVSEDAVPVLLLLRRRPLDALQATRELVAREPEPFRFGSDFRAYGLIRAELACGHGEAAERLISARREIGNCHVLDDFMLARARLLTANREQAAAHFATFLAAVERCRAEGRLDFELRLAAELSAADAALLVRRAMTGAHIAEAGAAPPPAVPETARLRGATRLVGVSRAIEDVRKLIRLLASPDVPVLITGETGTGKELVARALHEESPRTDETFVSVNCGAIAETLLESELFGHERGAFTGAERARRGLFEEAGAGTVFLDEIGEISPRLQVSLLRVLETGEIRPVGASRERRVRCRILAATNADLDALAARGAFRQDLLFRLKRMEIRIPPLRERREDVLPLAAHFFCEGRTDGRRPELAEDLKRELCSRDWPGNVRELRNAVERMRLLNSDGLHYDLGALGFGAQPSSPAPAPEAADEPAAEATRAAAMPGDAEISQVLAGGRTALRRRERLMGLFARCRRLTRSEIVQLMKVSPATATADLKALVSEGLVGRVEPSSSTRSHYFVLKKPEPSP